MIPHALHDLPFVERFYTFTELESTNTHAKELLRFPEKGIYVIQADTQSKGRGREGNEFFSCVKGGLWVSIITHIADLSVHFNHNRALSVAICQSITNKISDAPVKIKWPNDIYWNDLKICGILLETPPSLTDQIIIGFGLNVNLRSEDFPQSLEKIATSLFMQTNSVIPLSELLRDILTRYWENTTASFESMHSIYTSLLYKTGHRITINNRVGIFEGVGVDGVLHLKEDEKNDNILSGTLRFLD